jgi:phosphatidate phosphatase APP1
MASWSTIFHRLVHRAESYFDELRWKIKRRLGRDKPVQIVDYYGFGTTQTLHLQGRVLANHSRRQTDSASESRWRNILAAYRRFESDEVPGVRVHAQYQDRVEETLSDKEGYFTFDLHTPVKATPQQPWHRVSLSLPDFKDTVPMVNAKVLVPTLNARFGVISDIDDTIVVTNATSFFKMVRLTVLKSARTRLPFAGVAAFYRALQRGTGKEILNPIFYVSSSPWNLYDFLVNFITYNDIPIGPLMLRDLGLDENKFIKSSHLDHKRTQIERLLNTYTNLPFILIGDSGQHDPEIYHQIANHFPHRIQAIYIRDVSPQPLRDKEVRGLAEKLNELAIDLILAKDSLAAAQHAAERGFINPEAVAAVQAEMLTGATSNDDIKRLVEEDE